METSKWRRLFWRKSVGIVHPPAPSLEREGAGGWTNHGLLLCSVLRYTFADLCKKELASAKCIAEDAEIVEECYSFPADLT